MTIMMEMMKIGKMKKTKIGNMIMIQIKLDHIMSQQLLENNSTHIFLLIYWIPAMEIYLIAWAQAFSEIKQFKKKNYQQQKLFVPQIQRKDNEHL